MEGLLPSCSLRIRPVHVRKAHDPNRFRKAPKDLDGAFSEIPIQSCAASRDWPATVELESAIGLQECALLSRLEIALHL